MTALSHRSRRWAHWLADLDDRTVLVAVALLASACTMPMGPVTAMMGAPVRAVTLAVAGFAMLGCPALVYLNRPGAAQVALLLALDALLIGLMVSDPSSPVWVCAFPAATLPSMRLGPTRPTVDRLLAGIMVLIGMAGGMGLPTWLDLPINEPALPFWTHTITIAVAFGSWFVLIERQVLRLRRHARAADQARDHLGVELAKREELLARLEQANARAEAATHAKSAFLANMSHEIRTPLAAVIGLIDVAMDSDRPVQELGLAKRSANHLLGLLNDVLDLSKIEAGALELDRQPTDVHAAVHDVVELTRVAAASKDLTIDLHIDLQRHPTRIVDGLRLKQVLHNLLSNAVKFTDEGAVQVRVLADGDQVRFEVQDDGIGMTPSQIDKALEPFQQAEASTTRRFGGTGLGLTIVTRILALMHSTLEVSSEPGMGTTMAFTARLRCAKAIKDQARTLPPTRIHAERLRILVAEDNPVNQMIARRLLEKRGQQVEVVSDGAQAVERADEAWDVILMDLQMPVLDGLEATRRIRAREATEGRTRVPIVALTANALAGDQESCEEAGMDGFLSKPLQATALDGVLLRLAARPAS